MTEEESNIIPAQSAVKEVTVYDSRAQVHRHSSVTLPKGVSCVRFRDLPNVLDRDSLQVSLMRSPNDNSQDPLPIMLRGVRFDTVEVDNQQYETLTEEQKKAAEKADALRLQIAELRDEMKMLMIRQSACAVAFDRATSSSSGVGEKIYQVDTWKTLIEQQMKSVEENLAQQREFEAKLRTLVDELKAAVLASSVSATRKVSYSVVDVLLVATQEVKEFVLVVAYMVNNASWTPEYEVRVNSATLEMKLMCNAVLRQSSSEDWTNARVSVSTASPSQNGRQPELVPWRVDIQRYEALSAPSSAIMRKAPRSMMRAQESRRAVANDDSDDDDEGGAGRATDAVAIESAAVSESAVAVSFTIPRPLTVLRDNEEVRCSLVALDFQTTLSYSCVPSLAEAVFASAKASNNAGFALRSGKAAIFLDGQYVASSTIPRTPAGEPVIVSVGRDETVKVTQKLLNRQRADDGSMFSGKKDSITYTYMTTIKNKKATVVSVKLTNRIPMSDNDELVVALVKPTRESLGEKEQKKLDNEGFVESMVTVKAGESVDVPLSFTVTSPAKSTVYGL